MRLLTVKVACHELIAKDKNAKQRWSDVWLSWRSGGKTHRACPLLCSFPELKYDAVFNQELLLEKPKSRYCMRAVKKTQRALDELAKSYYYVERERGDKCGTVYTQAEWITQGEAQRCAIVLLRARGFLQPLRFVWDRPKTIVYPTSFVGEPEPDWTKVRKQIRGAIKRAPALGRRIRESIAKKKAAKKA